MQQYSAFIKPLKSLDQRPIANADLRVIDFEIGRDLLSKKSSKIRVIKLPPNIQEGSFIGMYDNYGTTVYGGVITSIEDNTINCEQAIGMFDDNWLWQNPRLSTIESTVKNILTTDFQNNSDVLMSSIWSQFDINTGSSTALTLPSQEPNYVKNFLDFIFMLYEKYSIIVDVNVPYVADTPTIDIYAPNYSSVKIGDYTNAIQDFKVLKEVYETNKLIIYSEDGSTLRGTYYGSTQGITTNSASPYRLQKINTNIVFSDDGIAIIEAQNLRNEMYNHQITCNLVIGNKLYDFNDFKLGQPFEIYENGVLYNSVLTGYDLKQQENGSISYVGLTFGIVRPNLTNKINKLKR